MYPYLRMIKDIWKFRHAPDLPSLATDWLTAHPMAPYVVSTSIDDARADGIAKAITTEKTIITGATNNRVITGATVDGVVTGAAHDGLYRGVQGQCGAHATCQGQGVATRSEGNSATTHCGAQCHGVVATATGDGLNAGCGQAVGAVEQGQAVVAGVEVDDPAGDSAA